ncbi:non-ribosomal peptide synthetase [Azorhizobium doebereinerae]|uniref:non-ribosomal peptide synthetase n=1 Tax=Azorhizobium doebereinerae TaxID=281091 RepID=UPI00041C58E5|nr:non-ribosomal peptide synthetase [Azorhizobium doebereinerae]
MTLPDDPLRAAMRQVLEDELVARARARLPARPAPEPPAAVPQSPAGDGLDADVLALTAAALRLPADQIDPRENLSNYGVDSIAITEVMTRISRFLGVSIAPTTFFEARRLDDLVAILRSRYGAQVAAHYARKAAPEPTGAPAPTPATAHRAEPDVASWLARHRSARAPGGARTIDPVVPAPAAPPAATQSPPRPEAPVAIIAMDGVFPQSPDIAAFEAHLRAGDDCITRVPPERWDWRAVDGNPKAGPRTDVHFGGFAPGHDAFDAAFFGISPKEAELMDPQHRLFMECVWQLIESAGYAPGALAGRNVGLFLGINLQDYADLANRAGQVDPVQLTGLGHVFCPNRLSFLLDIHGPSQVIDTACSSSLVALHRAVMSIRHEGCEMAIAGGANLMLTPTQHILFSRVGMLSRDGRCKTFSRDADGYGRADGVGAVLLKRLDAAERDGDTILGVIRASAENHGGGATSLTAPNPRAQARLVAETHRRAGIDPRTVTLIECHGTGTPLGDPVEVEGLKAAFAELYADHGLPIPASPHCGLGSVKSNIGHAETAAGIAGVIKVLLSLRAGTLYRTLHCERPNPLIDLSGTPFYLLSEARPWTRPVVEGREAPRRAGVSSFGAGGANAHVVIEEYRAPASVRPALAGPFVVPLSARTPEALRQGIARLAAHLEASAGDAAMEDIAFTLQTGRDAMRVRAAFVARDRADLLAQLRATLADDRTAFRTLDRKAVRGPVVDPVAADLDAPALATRWLDGASIDWARLYVNRRPRRLPLPTYAFQHKRFWLPQPEAAAEASTAPVLRALAPGRYAVDLDAAAFYLRDHAFDGSPVLPGVMYLELMRRAAEMAGATGDLAQMVWLKRLDVPTTTHVEIAVIRDPGLPVRVELSHRDADGAAVLHAQARVTPPDRDAPDTVDIAALKARCDRRFDADAVYAAFTAMGLAYGPAHRAIAWLAVSEQGQNGAREVLAHLALPDPVAGTADAFALHPSLMDGAFQAAIGMALDADGRAGAAALPFALDRLEVLGACAPQMMVRIRPAAEDTGGKVRRLDLDLTDMVGQVRVRMHGFTTRAPTRDNTETLLYTPRWSGLPPISTAQAAVFGRRVALLCGFPDGTAERLSAALPDWEIRTSAGEADTAASVLAQGTAVLGLAQDAARTLGAGGTLLQVVVPATEPLWAGLSGLLRSARMEYPGLHAQLIRADTSEPATLAQRLARIATTGEADVCLDGAGMLARRWEPLAVAGMPLAAPWRDGGVYLLTGGTGGIGGRLAAEIMARAADTRLILVGRAADGPAIAEKLAGLSGRNGAQVIYRSLDLVDGPAVEALLADIRARFGRLDGVLHAAGVLQDGPLARKTPDDLARVLAPKVAGTLNLDRALGDAPLDLFVLFASLSGAMGNAGQADYALANACLDAFAAEREARRRTGACHGRTLAVDWPLWRDGGMVMDEASRRLMARTTGLAPLETEAAFAALYRALASDAPQVLVAAGDRARIEAFLAPPEAVPVVAEPTPAVAIDGDLLRHRTLAALIGLVSTQLKVAPEDLAADMELSEYGFDSISFTQFANALNERFDLALTPTVFFEYPTLGDLAGHFSTAHAARFAERLGVVATPAAAAPARPQPAPVASAAPLVPRAATPDAAMPIAIIGMSGIFPGAGDPEALWANLLAERDCIGDVPPERWDWRRVEAEAPGTVHRGGFIDGIAAFDAPFFGLSATEARMMDPQQRLLLTQAWRVMEDAGYAPSTLAGMPMGVFVGIADTGYGRLAAQSGAAVEGYAMTGLAPSVGPNRISFQFNFTGPSVAVETACSSALVAVHRAAEALRSGDCELAIAGGVNTLLMPDSFIGFTKAGMLAPDGRCKTFSAEANGYGRGEGIGLVLLKPLAAAERDGDRILAVIRASAENHGGRASSLTAPNPKAQAALLRTAYRRAGFDPRSLTYVEAHGTGTPLGDPIELEALTAAFADLAREAEQTFGPAPAMRCGIGSVKSNIGHLELAAGAAGLIKVLLQMRHGMLARSLHCDTPNPYLKLDGGPFRPVQQGAPWARPRDAAGQELPRRAGVSSFGFGGSNAHVVLEEYVPATVPAASPAPEGPALILLSARSEEQLRDVARDLEAALAGLPPEVTVADIAFTLQIGRDAMEHRLAFPCADRAELGARLAAFLAGRTDDQLRFGRVKAGRETLALLDSDAEVRRALAGLPARGRHDLLLDLWVRGFAFDWRSLYGAQPPRRVRLPGYPFARTEYWVRPTGGSAPRPPEMPAAPPVPAITEVPVHQETVTAERDFVAEALAHLTRIAAAVLETDTSVLDPVSEFGEFGFDSVIMTSFAAKVNTDLGLSLTPADFFEFASLGRLARHVAGAMERLEPAPSAADVLPPPAVAAALPAAASPPEADDPVAIVGMSCRFPGAADADAFWDNLVAGRDAIGEIPPDRWDWRAFDGDPKTESNRTNIRWGGFIEGVYDFDPLFFGISPREARMMDPQQRLILMHAWSAIEDAGHSPRSLAGRAVGLFVGTSSSGYRDLIGAETGADGYLATGAAASVGPNRVSFFLDWHGPSEPVETACSSALVAIHRAMQAMAAGDCEMAVAGGVNTMLTPEAHINFAKAGMLSPDGRCHTFSAQANGYVRGEGVGMVVLKRLSAAERDGDAIYALVRGSALNHGGRANSLTAPNTVAQADLLRQAYRQAGVDVRAVGYVEAHGTGTELGDPVEVNALKSAFAALGGGPQNGKAWCGLGAVKTNIGHLELAAGVAGVIKVLLQMRHRILAPSLNATPPNPYIDLSGSPFFVVREAQPWVAPQAPDGTALPLRAGVSSFGFGGVNAHIVLEEYRDRRPRPAFSRGPVLIPLSAREPAQLREQAGQLARFIATGRLEAADLADLAFTLQEGRAPLAHRLALVADDLSDLGNRLAAFAAGETAGVILGKADLRTPGPELSAETSLDALARHWVEGGAVDWRAVSGPGRRRLHLPTYPFSRETYRADAMPKPIASAEVTVGSGDGPIRLSPEAFYLRDHRVMGTPVLPGAMTLELARAAAARTRGADSAALALTQVVWLLPVRVAQTTFAQIDLDAAQAPGTFRLTTADAGGTVLHAQGRIEALGEGPTDLDPAVLAARCPRAISPAELYATFAGLGLDYGPAFRAVHELRAGEGEALGLLRLPDAAGRDPFTLHPSLLDGAFQSCLALFQTGGEAVAAVPFALDRIDILGATVEEMWVHARLRPGEGAVRRIDMDMADIAGRILVRLRGFSVRALPPQGGPGTSSRVQTENQAEAAVRHLAGLVAEEARVPLASVEADAPLEAYGIDSILITRLTDRLEADLGPLSKTLFFEHRTLQALATHLLAAHGPAMANLLGRTPAQPQPTSGGPTQRAAAMPAAAAARREMAPNPRGAGEPIAIVGLAGRYPGARTLAEFWDNLAAGRDCITEVPPERWDAARLYDPARGAPGRVNSRWGGFLDGVDQFDPLFFNISPREAEFIDPQERLFLQCAWEALEDAGHTPASLASGEGGANVGVFVGVMYEEYQLYGAERTQAGHPVALSGVPASIANRVSYFCDFHGPSMAVDSMCSSSLTALQLACDSIRAGHCSAALAGGVNLSVHPNKYLALAQGRFLSSSGRCESFGRGGDGYVPGEGVGAVLLKPLSDALADGDQIYGIVRGTALNHGGKTHGYTVPNPHAQAAVISRALTQAGVSPDDISYVEAHGTGTALGDPIEISALTTAFRAATERRGFCAIGSVKSNIGHCESAAGMAGLTKVLLQMKHGRLVPSLHAETLNPAIDFAASPFVVQRTLASWLAERPRMAGLSSFGAGGSNAHVVMEEYPALTQARPLDGPAIFPFSARDGAALERVLQRFRAALDSLDDTDLPAAAGVLQEGREAFEVRLAIVAQDRADLAAALDRALAHAPDGPGLRRGTRGPAPGPDVVERCMAAHDLDGLARLWTQGAKIDWPRLRGGPAPRKISLPAYPFARERYWVPDLPGILSDPPPAMPARAVQDRVRETARLPLLFAPAWEAAPVTPAAGAPERVLVLLCGFTPSDSAAIARACPDADCRVLATDPTDAARFADAAAGLLAIVQDVLRARTVGLLLQLVIPADEEAGLWQGLGGLLRTAGQEQPGLRCQMLAVDGAPADIGASLRRERTGTDGDVRFGPAGRSVRRWTEIAGTPRAPSPWKDNGVYLVTGGTGGLGRILCRDIADHAQGATLWVTGRSPRPDDIGIAGAQVVHRRLDMTDAGAVHALVQEILAAHGRLDGIVHAAGVTRDKLLVRKTEDEFRAVLAPKVAGLEALDAASAHCTLDLFLLFASVSGALGNAGQCDYATGNAFMDAFAARRAAQVARGARSGLTLSLDWPYWRDGGMHLAPETLAAMARGFGVAPLEREAGLAALRAGIAAARAGAGHQILVLDGDHTRLRAAMRPMPAAPPVAAPPTGLPNADDVAAHLAALFTRILKLPEGGMDRTASFDRYGLDSVSAQEVIEALEQEELGPLPRTLLFEYPTLDKLAAALIASHGARLAAISPPPSALPASAHPVPAPDAPPSGTSPAEAHPGEIAVIAVAGRYPGAESVEALWEALRAGQDLVTEVPPGRWDNAALYAPEKGRPGRTACNWGGFLEDVDCFDAGFFGISPREAARLDPQERLLLETTWHLLERAGHTRAALQQRYDARVGVFVGAMYQQYHAFDADPDDKALVSLASYASLANRLSFFFDLQGPSVALDTMCSSGLEAVHLACQSLLRGECGLAIAAAVNLSIHPLKYLGLSRAGLVGSSAESRSFADGDGYLPAEGVGAVLLKPLADARRDGDAIIGVIKASGSNHGGHSAGYGVPSAEAQARLITETIRAAGIDPVSIGYWEAAANGAAMGDAIEVRAATRALRSFTPAAGFCALGSVKANMGHGEAVSGLAQLTKCLLQLQHRELAPTRRPGHPNPDIDLDGTPFVFLDGPTPWQAAGPRRASVSSFGAGGSNVHLILEEAPPAPVPPQAPDRLRRFVFSARDDARLGVLLARMADFVRARPGLDLARMAATLRDGRERMPARADIFAANRAELLAALEAWPALPPAPAAGTVEEPPAGPPMVLPVYPFARERHWLRPATLPTAEASTSPLPTEPRALIAAILAAETGLAPQDIPADASFRDLGATSMFALRLQRTCADLLGIDLSLREMETHGSLAALATFLGTRVDPETRTPLDAPAPISPEPIPGADRLPLAEGQKGLWALQSLHPESSGYNVPLAFRATGVDVAALDRAGRALVARFPILEDAIRAVDGEPWRMPGTGRVPLTFVEVPDGEDETAFARARAARPFDLSAAPMRMEFLHRAGDTTTGIVLLVVHHIVFDGVSAAVVARVFWDAYDYFANGTVPPPPPPQTDFSAFVAWEQGHVASPRGEAQLAYWQARLGGDLPVMELPADRPAARGQGVAGRSLERTLPPDLIRAARTAATTLGVNPSALFLGVLAMLLRRYTGQDDMVVGMPTMRRPARRFEGAVGYFANMMGLRLGIDGGMPAGEVVRAAQAGITDGLDHADYPFARLLRQIGRTAGDPPLFAVTFAYQNFLDDRLMEPLALKSGVEVSYLAAIRQEGDGALGFEVHEDGSQVKLVVTFDAGRFEMPRISAMTDHFCNLLASVCAQPDAPVSRQEMLAPEERVRLLETWGHGPALAERPGGVLDWIRAQAARTPDAIAVVCGDRSLSYRKLIRRSNRLAAYLHSRGLRPGAKVAVLLEREPRSLVTLLAVWSVGAVWVPLDAEHPDARLAAIVADAGASAIVTDAAHARRADALVPRGTLVVQLDRLRSALRTYSAEARGRRPAPQDAAYMIYTSGSTGTPKGVVVSHGAIATHCLAATARLGIEARDHVLQFAALGVDTALEQILPALACGARLVMRGPDIWSPAECRDVLAEQAVTVADLPPLYLAELLRTLEQPGPGVALRLLICGGERLPPELVRQWRSGPLAQVRLVNAYGPTEATITATAHDVRPGDGEGPVPIGTPLPGVTVRLMDTDGNPVPEGVPGELYLGGPERLALGYHQRPDLTRERFVADPFAPADAPERLYRTGDRAVFLRGGAGILAFLGRVDDQVKIRGHRVELGEVEAALRTCGCRAAAVVAQPDALGDMALTAFVAMPGAGFEEAALLARLARHLPSGMLPRRIVRVEALPVTPAGKVDRTALRARPPGDASGSDTERRQASGEERVGDARSEDDRIGEMLDIWRHAFGPEAETAIRPESDFFALGGHSLLAVRLLGALERRFGLRLAMADLVDAPTPARLALRLRPSGAPAAPALPGVRLLKAGQGEPLVLVHAAGGTTACYVPLVRLLETGRPVYGLDTPLLDPAQPERAWDVPSLAAHHLATLRRMNAAGGCDIAGWSLGGVIAYEMARQCRAAGEDGGLLVLIDSYAPDLLRALEGAGEGESEGEMAEAALLRAFARDGLGVAVADTGLRNVADLALRPDVAGAIGDTTPEQLEGLYRIFRTHARAARSYRPAPFAGPALLYAAAGGHADPARGWDALLPDLSPVSIAGDHYSCMAAPLVADLAGCLSRELARRPASRTGRI